MLSELTAEHPSPEHPSDHDGGVGTTESSARSPETHTAPFPTPQAVTMQKRIVTLTTMYVALVLCMTSGWHTWPLGIGLALWIFGYRIIDDRNLHISDAELYIWLNSA